VSSSAIKDAVVQHWHRHHRMNWPIQEWDVTYSPKRGLAYVYALYSLNVGISPVMVATGVTAYRVEKGKPELLHHRAWPGICYYEHADDGTLLGLSPKTWGSDWHWVEPDGKEYSGTLVGVMDLPKVVRGGGFRVPALIAEYRFSLSQAGVEVAVERILEKSEFDDNYDLAPVYAPGRLDQRGLQAFLQHLDELEERAAPILKKQRKNEIARYVIDYVSEARKILANPKAKRDHTGDILLPRLKKRMGDRAAYSEPWFRARRERSPRRFSAVERQMIEIGARRRGPIWPDREWRFEYAPGREFALLLADHTHEQIPVAIAVTLFDLRGEGPEAKWHHCYKLRPGMVLNRDGTLLVAQGTMAGVRWTCRAPGGHNWSGYLLGLGTAWDEKPASDGFKVTTELADYRLKRGEVGIVSEIIKIRADVGLRKDLCEHLSDRLPECLTREEAPAFLQHLEDLRSKAEAALKRRGTTRRKSRYTPAEFVLDYTKIVISRLKDPATRFHDSDARVDWKKGLDFNMGRSIPELKARIAERLGIELEED